MTPYPVIKDADLSEACCPPKGGVKELHNVHRTLPRRVLHNSDPQVLQDESGEPFLDEQTLSFMYDDLRNF